MNRFQQALASVSAILFGLLTSAVDGQHSLFRGDVPGSLAFRRLLAEPSIAGYDQPVQIVLTDGGEVSYFDASGTAQPLPAGMLLGMQVGPVYSLRVESVLRGEAIATFPTIEMLDRLYPPDGLALRHPVKIVLTTDDIDDASQGHLVTKLIYLEDPDTALPYRQTHLHQATLDIGLGQRPFSVAERLGRPIAIVRLGSRQHLPCGESLVQPSPVLLPEDLSSAVPNPAQVIGDCCPRSPADPCQGSFRCLASELACANSFRRDEFLCDGADRPFAAVLHRDDQLVGLDLEDTVAWFESSDGRIDVVPSNRVCIYAPRFAAVRQLLSSSDTTITQQLNVVNEQIATDISRWSDFSSTTLQQIQTQSNRQTQRPSAFRDQTRGVVADNTVHLVGVRHEFKPYENLQLIRFGKFSTAERARISLGMQSAAAWESDLSAQITINNSQPVIVNDVYQVQELVTIDTDASPDLRLCKLASLIAAKPGETVDFTIRFDNIGRKRLEKVTIVDNLTPRLEYSSGTAECSVDAEFSVVPNTAGSQTLRWEISEPLEIGSGGIIRFRCIVR